jgi:hypothetical protein
VQKAGPYRKKHVAVGGMLKTNKFSIEEMNSKLAACSAVVGVPRGQQTQGQALSRLLVKTRSKGEGISFFLPKQIHCK